ncbi:MAG: AEC family transporter [Lachnospiraceae bacterium]|nr:AEC family transporter [Lachnospiraceae bacterium]
MLSIFAFAVNAVFPIILLMLLGYFLKQIHFFNDNFLSIANKFVFRVALPSLLFYNLYEINALGDIEWNIVFFALAVILTLFAIGFVCVRLTIKDNRQKGVILQCFFRSNFALIGFPLSEALGGAGSLAIAAVLSAFTIPMFNILAVIALTVFLDEENATDTARDSFCEANTPSANVAARSAAEYADTHKNVPAARSAAAASSGIRVKDILIKIAKNPLIIGVFLGLAVLFIRGFIPTDAGGEHLFSIKNSLPFLYSALASVSKTASPLALIVLGGQFSFKAIKGLLPQIAYGTLVRTVIVPATALTLAVLLSTHTGLLNLGSAHYASLIALFGSPIAVSSAIMAGEMGNDSELAGQLVVWTSLVSMFTLFVIIMIMRGMGLL